MDFQDLLTKIYVYKTSYISLLYANNLFVSHFLDNFSACNYNQDTIITATDRIDETSFLINPGLIKQQISYNQQIPEEAYPQAITEIVGYNAHFLRTRILNAVFEIIKKYYEQPGKDINKYYLLHGLGWFRMLYALRNIASHADNLDNVVKLPRRHHVNFPIPEDYPDTIEWNGITVTRGQAGNVRYNDLQVLQLIQTVFETLGNNRAQWI